MTGRTQGSGQHTFGLAAACFAFALLACAPATLAQSSTKAPPNAMQGFSQNRDKPIVLSAERAERREKDKSMVLSGNVKVVQGDTTMRAKSLVVFTDAAPASKQAPGKAAPKAAMPGGGSEQISRIEARGGVTVVQKDQTKDQTVTGDSGTYDVRSGLITMIGNVLLTQEKNVVRADRLVVNITTGDSQLECDAGKSCVQMIIDTTKTGGGGAGPASLLPGAATPNRPARPDAPKSGEPQRLTPR